VRDPKIGIAIDFPARLALRRSVNAHARRPVIYMLVSAAAVATFLSIRACGNDLHAPEAAAPRIASATITTTGDMLLHILLALLVVIVVARVAALVLGRWRQAPVIGEIVAGILLGPSLLGKLAPQASHFLFPAAVVPVLGALSQLGIVLYMFLVGLRLDAVQLRRRAATSIAVSHASIVVPFLLGAALALWLYPRFSSSDVPFSVFALFLGVSMSITAFPVLARILSDRGLATTQLGTIALTCAAVGDVTAWCLLALLVGVVRSTPEAALVTIGLTGVFVAGMVLLVRPAAQLLRAMRDERGQLTQWMFLVVCVALLGAAVTAEYIGIHALFGAFMLGVVVPHDSALVRDVTARLEDVVVVMLLPAFFAFAGMRTELGLVSGWNEIFACAVIVIIASAGKLGGSFAAARATGLDVQQSLSLGILMNTRGLMELIVLNIGLDLGVLSPTLFTMLTIMALVTTFATSPILDRLRRSEPCD
jgi:Kef-type K+ transport system membrane component KefB